MTEVAQVTYYHAESSSLSLFTSNTRVVWGFQGKSVERQPDKVGISVDPNQVFRTVSCSATLTSTELGTLNGFLMPASAPTYGGTYPKIEVKIDGSTTWTVLCMITGAQAQHRADNKWMVALEFTERSA